MSLSDRKEEASLIFKLSIIIALISCLLYANTLRNKYVFDDIGLAINNTMIEKGISAIPEIFSTGYRSTLTWKHQEFYRPIPKLLHAIMWQLAPRNPAAAHALNILLFCAICLVLFKVLIQWFDNLYVAFSATVLFCVHPIHTEVVANIKSIDELTSFLFAMSAFYFFMHYIKKLKPFDLCLSILFYVAALLSKESAIIWSITIPFTIYFFKQGSLKQTLMYTFFFLLISGLYLYLRHIILGESSTTLEPTTNSLVAFGNPLLQKANALYIYGIYIKQMILPYPLISEASYHYFNEIDLFDSRFILVAVLFIGMLCLVIQGWKQRTWYAFCIIYFLLTSILTANILFLTGTNYAERFLFAASLSWCIALPNLIQLIVTQFQSKKSSQLWFQHYQIHFQWLMLPVIVYGFITLDRNGDWRSTPALFSHDVLIGPETARLQCYYASSISAPIYLKTLQPKAQKENISNAIEAYKKAIEIYPAFHQAYSSLADLFVNTNNLLEAENAFQKCIRLNPSEASYYNNFGHYYFNQGRLFEAIPLFKKALSVDPHFAPALCNMGSSMGSMAVQCIHQADSLTLNHHEAAANQLKTKANTYFKAAIHYFELAIANDPWFSDPHKYLQMTYSYLGNGEKSMTHQQRFNKIIQREKSLSNPSLYY